MRMTPRLSHALQAWIAALALVPATALAQTLDLETAQRLALERQPRIEAFQAQGRAEREAAVAEEQLPDPKLMTGVRDFPIDGPAAGSFDDDFTMIEIGVSQDFTLGSKRRLMGERARHQAQAADAMAEQARRQIRRDTGLAWLDVFLPERAAALAEAQRLEAERFAQATEIAFRAGRAPQSDVLSARVGAELLADRVAELRQEARQARGMLSRWIGEHADGALPEQLPAGAAPANLDELMRHVESHPHLEALAQEEAAARTQVALAEKGYRPDWSADAYYGNRPDFPDYVGLRLTMDLPVFTGNRQDRRVEESRARLSQAGAQRQDALREQAAEARAVLAVWHDSQARLARFDERVVPQARTAAQAAQASYAAGQGTLAGVLQARQAALDAELQRLKLAVYTIRAQLKLRYFFE
jgi:outer membrane protein, heavy metal efflux system